MTLKELPVGANPGPLAHRGHGAAVRGQAALEGRRQAAHAPRPLVGAVTFTREQLTGWTAVCVPLTHRWEPLFRSVWCQVPQCHCHRPIAHGRHCHASADDRSSDLCCDLLVGGAGACIVQE